MNESGEADVSGEFRGWHVLAEFGGVDAGLCDDPVRLEQALRDALTGAGATICDVVHKQFEPHGVTVLALLAESHASLHTYPESGDIFIDVFTCGTIGDAAEQTVELLRSALAPTDVSTSTLRRGRGAEHSE